MIELTRNDIWKSLSSAFGNSEKVPDLLLQLENTFDKDLADTICFEYLTHQNSLYQITLVTVPHLVRIMNNSNDLEFQLNILINLGMILSELDSENAYLNSIINDDTLDDDIKFDLKSSMLTSLEELEKKVKELIAYVKEQKLGDTFFLSALATFDKRYSIARVFVYYSTNDEYPCLCESCNKEYNLCNESNKLYLYQHWSNMTSNPPQKILPVKLSSTNSVYSSLNWLQHYVEMLNIESLKPLLPYFFSDFMCPDCNTKNSVFKAILDGVC